MSENYLIVHDECNVCDKLMKKYPKIINDFKIVNLKHEEINVEIEYVPSLIVNQELIQGKEVFMYLDDLVEELNKKEKAKNEKHHGVPNRQFNTFLQKPKRNTNKIGSGLPSVNQMPTGDERLSPEDLLKSLGR